MRTNPLVQKIYATIANIQPLDAREKAHIADTLTWIESGAPLFRIAKPATPDKHLCVYFVVFDDSTNKILLVDHIKAQLWLPTGGHVDIDEDPFETVRRECREELGIEADCYLHEPLFLTSTLTVGLTGGHTDVNLWYVVRGNAQHTYAFDKHEFKSIRWFSFDDIPYHLSDVDMQRFVTKLLSTLPLLQSPPVTSRSL